MTESSGTSETGAAPPKTVRPELVFFRGVSRLLFYLALGLGLFFGAAVLVLSLRQRSPEKSVMPEVVDRYYLDVHNELSREQLRVSLSTRSFPDVAPGLILHQSIPPGSTIQPRDKLYLVVNQPEPMFDMPRFVGNSMQSAQAVLGRMTHGQLVYTIAVGSVARVPDDSPKDTILAQYPAAGSRISVGVRAHFLVSDGPEAKGKQAASPEIVKGLHLSVAREYLHRTGLDYRISKLEGAERHLDVGQVRAVTAATSGPVLLNVAYNEPAKSFLRGYELVRVKLKGEGTCEAVAATEGGPDRLVFRTAKYTQGEEVRILFFRQGSEKLRVTCGSKVLFEKTFRPDDLG